MARVLRTAALGANDLNNAFSASLYTSQKPVESTHLFKDPPHKGATSNKVHWT